MIKDCLVLCGLLLIQCLSLDAMFEKYNIFLYKTLFLSSPDIFHS